jgi:hypothetical protein
VTRAHLGSSFLKEQRTIKCAPVRPQKIPGTLSVYNRGLILKRLLKVFCIYRKSMAYHLSFRAPVHFKRSQSGKMRSALNRCSLWLIGLLVIATFGQTSESAAASAREYRLRFYHTHTRERLDIVYRRGDTYLAEAVDELDHYLRPSNGRDTSFRSPPVRPAPRADRVSQRFQWRNRRDRRARNDFALAPSLGA